ncbi:dephospho-CoA kinase [Gracilaria domingensis]|nr:dephospho-CoA kinase [Gracilaria domingensis]
MPKIVGLTGGIASGKSTVSAIWSSKDITIIDADKIAKEVVQPGRPSYWLIKRHFGPSILNPDGTVNRSELGKLVFSNAKHRKALNLRTHPFIIYGMLSRLFIAVFIKWRTIVVLDTPLLFESGTLLPFCSATVVVTCTPQQQLDRLVQRDSDKGITEDEARRRIASQMPLEEKTKRATYIIDNTGDEHQLRTKAFDTLDKLKPSRAGELALRGLVLAALGNIFFRFLQR